LDDTFPQFGHQQENLLSRAGIYELLARLILKELDEDTLKLFKSPGWKRLFNLCDIHPPEPTEALVESLAIDYCRVFIGPNQHCPPYQSVWNSGQLASELMDSMSQFQDFIKPRSESSIKDHFGIQLEMMAFILVFQNQNPQERGSNLAKHFFNSHVQWGQRLMAAATKRSDCEFYQKTFNMAAKWIAHETQHFNSPEQAPKK
jgi:TorA maturation chaperone TorD